MRENDSRMLEVLRKDRLGELGDVADDERGTSLTEGDEMLRRIVQQHTTNDVLSAIFPAIDRRNGTH